MSENAPVATRDHGGRLDAAMARYGGKRADWVDLSTGINPDPWPIPAVAPHHWTALPDRDATDALTDAARRFWLVPDGAAVLAAPGASALIAQIPRLASPPGRVAIPGPTYNEHAAAFAAQGWDVRDHHPAADCMVVVHPNNPDGRCWADTDLRGTINIIDESFADTMPDRSLIARATTPGTVILKSFGKFWGLAGLRLGFAIGDPALVHRLAGMLGPWPVSGPALAIGRAALEDTGWAAAQCARLMSEADRLDALLSAHGAKVVGGTSLFRLFAVDDASAWADRLARRHVLARTFPYNPNWLRLGLPAANRWAQVEAAL